MSKCEICRKRPAIWMAIGDQPLSKTYCCGKCARQLNISDEERASSVIYEVMEAMKNAGKGGVK